MTTENPQQLIETYFERATDPDREGYFALFADDVVVEDEGRERRGIEEVRVWRTEVPPVTYTLVDVTSVDEGWRAVARVAGDFPGSPVDLAFVFRFDDESLIDVLRIRPTEAP